MALLNFTKTVMVAIAVITIAISWQAKLFAELPMVLVIIQKFALEYLLSVQMTLFTMDLFAAHLQEFAMLRNCVLGSARIAQLTLLPIHLQSAGHLLVLVTRKNSAMESMLHAHQILSHLITLLVLILQTARCQLLVKMHIAMELMFTVLEFVEMASKLPQNNVMMATQTTETVALLLASLNPLQQSADHLLAFVIHKKRALVMELAHQMFVHLEFAVPPEVFVILLNIAMELRVQVAHQTNGLPTEQLVLILPTAL
jgi:hypothetical protein